MHNTKGNIKRDVKISFCSWAWPYIPLFHYTGVNGTAPLPQGQFKLLLASSSSLPYMLFIWRVPRKARRGKLPRTVQQSWCGAEAPGRVPGRAQGITTTPHTSVSGSARVGSHSHTLAALWDGRYKIATPSRILPSIHVLGGTQGRSQSWPLEVSCLKDGLSSLSQAGVIWLC